MARARAWFKAAGVDFAGVPGASLAFTGTGIRVTQTPANLEKIRAIAAQLSSRTNVAIEAKVVEMSAEDFAALDLGRYLLDGARPGTLTIPVGSKPVEGRPNTPPPLTGRFDVPALLRALTQPPGRATLLAVPDMIVLSGAPAWASANSEFRYPQSYGETPSPAAPNNAPALSAGTPQDFTVRGSGAEIRITVIVDDDGHTIWLKQVNSHMTVLANGARVGDSDLSHGAEGSSPARPRADARFSRPARRSGRSSPASPMATFLPILRCRRCRRCHRRDFPSPTGARRFWPWCR